MGLIQGFTTAVSQLNSEGSPLTTGDAMLDSALGGGFYRGCLTEISGVAGVGKSQLCTMLAAKTMSSGKNVVYLDTERGFSLKRCSAIYRAHTGKSMDETTQLLHKTVNTLQEFCEAVEGLVINRDMVHASLIVVDSIAYFFRGYEIKSVFPELMNVLKHFGILATRFNIAVVLINHVTDRVTSDGSYIQTPFMEHVFAYRAAIRIWLERSSCGERYLEVCKNPFGRETQPTKFVIKDEGLQLV